MFLAANSTSTINDVEPGLLGFLVVAVLALALRSEEHTSELQSRP